MRKLLLATLLILFNTNLFAYGTGGNDSNTYMLYHFEGANGATSGSGFSDDSQQKQNITRVGGSITTSSPKFGGSSYTVGSNSVADAANQDMGTGDFCFGSWAYFTSASFDGYLIEKSFLTGGGYAMEFRPAIDGITWFKGGPTAILTRAFVPTTNIWYHIEVDRKSGSTMLFVNGVQQGASATDTTDYSGTSGNIGVGYNVTNDGNPIVGNIDEFIYKKGTYCHDSNFTPPSTPYCSGCEMSQMVGD